jgi:hypothetical protein
MQVFSGIAQPEKRLKVRGGFFVDSLQEGQGLLEFAFLSESLGFQKVFAAGRTGELRGG